MKVDIRHTRHWDLENKRPRGVDGYQQFTCPLERIQSRKRGLSRLQNLLYYSPEMKVFDHHPQLEIFARCFQTSSALRASNSREPLWIEPGWDCFHEAHTWCGIVRCFTFSDHLITSLYSWLSKNGEFTTASMFVWPLLQMRAVVLFPPNHSSETMRNISLYLDM